MRPYPGRRKKLPLGTIFLKILSMSDVDSSSVVTTPPSGKFAEFPVVGIGASAGGLDALQQLLRAMPADTGMGFAIVQHLAPDRASSLTEILARATTLPVSEVHDETAVARNHVYVIPPGRDMIIAGGKLQLQRQERQPRHRVIDQFFRSLAQDSGHQAIGVVLSGGATDGTLGLEAIKAEGGVTFAQDESAQHDSMPKSAVSAGCVDFVLPPEGIAQEIARIARHPYVASPALECGQEEISGHGRILEIVRRATGVDFTHYKGNTMQRRIHRRMMVHKIATLAEYEELLRATPAEIEALHEDVLISVTRFFRNPEAYEALTTKVFPKLLADCPRHAPVRMWSLGCSTGEEAYSLAMLFAECAEAAQVSAQLQLFASDLNATVIEKARIGRYPRSIEQDLSPERLRNFFVEEDGQYRVNKGIRECVIFTRHNVLTDPPFSRMDFISCRNLLIYLEPVLQEQVMHLLHYALKPNGVLWLGSSESLGTARELFEVEDARHNIFIRRPGPTPTGLRSRSAQSTPIFPGHAPGPRETPQTMLHRAAERALLSKYGPPGVVVNARLEVVQFRGDTGAFLAPAPGLACHDLLKMLREGLLVPVRTALARAAREGAAVREEGARVKSDTGYLELAIEVIPLKAGPGAEAGFAIVFNAGPAPRTDPNRPPPPPALTDSDEVARLTRELATTREYLQSVIEQQDAANEELQSANEEAQSSNEEMQSIIEELETSKEEIQSSNEELATVNDELNDRNVELNSLNNDLNNVLASTQLAILMVSRDLRIRRFTPAAEKTLQLTARDVGRPLGDIKLSMTLPELQPLLREAIDHNSPRERDVQDADGRWLSMCVRPYLTHANKIDGAVVTLVDVDKLRRARDFSENIVASVPAPLVVLDGELCVKMASHAFYEHFEVTPQKTVGRLLYDLGNHQWNIPGLRRVLEELLPLDQSIVDYQVRHTFERLGPRIMLLNARRLDDSPRDEPHILLFIEDISERTAAAEASARLAAIVESSDDAIIGKDLDGVITTWNHGAERLFGYTAAEIVGQHVTVLFPPERQHEEAQILSHIRHGQAVEHFETVRRHKDGTLFDASLTASPIRNGGGKIIGASTIMRNITERKQAGDALQASEEFKRSIIASSPDCIKVLDLQGTLLSLEAGHALLGLSDFTTFVGTSWVDLWLDPKDHAAAAAAVATAAAGGAGAFVGFYRTPGGQDKWWDVAVTPIRDATGQPMHLLAVSRDVTERRLLEDALVARAEQLVKADRRKDEFLAMLAHELRNPLAPLRNAAEILQAQEVGTYARAEAHRMISRQIEHMSRMLEDLLDVSRITEGKIELRREPVTLDSILRAAESLVRPTCDAHKQKLFISLPDEPVYLNADATRMEQVFGNLLTNACKYSGDDGHIFISAELAREAEPPEVVVTVRDYGAGIDPELLPHIFDLFVQASRSLDRSHGGLGIGLTLVQRLVELHGGSVEVHSEGLGHGAAFVVHLPILADAPLPEPLPAPPADPSASRPKRRILIVDDNTDAAMSLAMLYELQGHETRTASTGPDGVVAATEFLPDVMLLDIGLPGMDGFEVARKIRAIPDLAGIRIIAMSGYGRAEDQAEAKHACFDLYMVKPVDLSILREWVESE
jgi:two-component system CheB/CheR fusion protein